MGKTKAEEREALRKIEQILEDFDPEDTYIGKAFEGCIEQAEENIRSDWMLSFRSRELMLEKKLAEAIDNLHESEEARVDLTKELNQKDDAIARLEDVKNRLSEEIGRMAGTLGEKAAAYENLEDKLEEAQGQISDLRQTILELKAKLYDVMTMEEDEW